MVASVAAHALASAIFTFEKVLCLSQASSLTCAEVGVELIVSGMSHKASSISRQNVKRVTNRQVLLNQRRQR